MKDFWKKLTANLAARLLAPVFLYLVKKGVITDSEAGQLALYLITGALLGLQTLYNWLIARWHIDLARLVTDDTSRKTLAEAGATVGILTKLAEAATPGPNPAAINAAIAIDETPRM